VSAPLKLAIKKLIKAPVEVKFTTAFNGSSASSAGIFGQLYNADIGTSGATNQVLLPSIIQGLESGQRIGNQIRPRALVLNIWANAANTADSASFVARMFVLESLRIRDSTLITTGIPMSTLLNYGQAQGGFDGYPSQLSAGVNRNEFKVYHDKLVKFDKADGRGPSLVNTFTGNTVAPTTNTMYHCRIVVKCPAVLRYHNAPDLYPDNFAPFFNAGYAIPSCVTGDPPDSIVTRLQIMVESTLYYTDE